VSHQNRLVFLLGTSQPQKMASSPLTDSSTRLSRTQALEGNTGGSLERRGSLPHRPLCM